MKMLKLSLFLGIAQSLLVLAYAQPAAEFLPPGSPLPRPQVRATPSEKSEAKAMRKAEGAIAAHNDMSAEGDPIPEDMAKVPKADRAAAGQARKLEAQRANRAGEITSRGEIGPSK